MMRITEIEMHNLLAFYGTDNKVALKNGENLLLYGENGSGKSSLCKALEIFFDGAAARPDFDVKYRNIWASPTDPSTHMRVRFIDEGTTSDLDAILTTTTPWVTESRLASGFLTYREMLKTHFVEEYRSNLFDLVIKEILQGFVNPGSGKILSEEWAEIEKEVEDFLATEWGDPLSVITDSEGVEQKVMDVMSDRIAEIGEKASDFDDALKAFLNQLNPKINEFLAFFDENLKIELVILPYLDRSGDPKIGTMIEYTNTDDDAGLLKELRDRAIRGEVKTGANNLLLNITLKKPIVSAEVHFFNTYIPGHQKFLNEARLSALAICIFLAALSEKSDPPQGVKLLFLDDVLIGLDADNRKPLLNILKEKFLGFQVFLTTHDRFWYELAKDELPVGWSMTEMYAKPVFDSDDNFIRETPAIFPEKGNIQKAQAYFDQFDYPAAGNALRKECERILKQYLPEGYILNSSGNTAALGELLLKLTEYFEDSSQTIPREILSEIIFFKNALFNPASHHDLRTTFYRNEIKKAFAAIEKLSNLPKIAWIPILHSSQELAYENPTSNFKARILIGDYVYKTTFMGHKSISKMKFYTDWWEKDGIEYWCKRTNLRHTDAEIARMTTNPHTTETIKSWITRLLGLTVEPDYFKEFKTSTDTLENLLQLP